MSLTICFSDGAERGFEDVEGKVETAYQVLPSGVLLHLRKDAGEKWHIVFEYSPHAWKHVYGTRFTHSTDNLGSTDGNQKGSTGGRMAVIQ